MRSKVRKFFALLLAVSLLSGTVSGTVLAETASGDLADYQEETGAAEASGSGSAATEPGLAGVPSIWWADAVNDKNTPEGVFSDYDGSQRDAVVQYVADTYDEWYQQVRVTLEINKSDLDKVIETDENESNIKDKLEVMGLEIVEDGLARFAEETSYAYQRYIYASGSRMGNFASRFVNGADSYSITFSALSRNNWFHTADKEKELRRLGSVP